AGFDGQSFGWRNECGRKDGRRDAGKSGASILCARFRRPGERSSGARFGSSRGGGRIRLVHDFSAAQDPFFAAQLKLYPTRNQPFAILELTLILSRWQIGTLPLKCRKSKPRSHHTTE